MQPTVGTVTQPTCTEALGSFTITNYDSTYTYAVSPTDGVTINGAFITAPSGTYEVTALIGSCPSIITTVIVDQQPTAGSVETVSTETCNGEEFSPIDLATLLPSGTPTGGTWFDVDGIGGLNGTIFSGFGIQAGLYTYSYEFNDGSVCNSKVDILITITDICEVSPCANILIHNAFTPNGDGTNEFFYIENIENSECYLSNKVEIYNRWGVLVYETDRYDNASRRFEGISEGRACYY